MILEYSPDCNPKSRKKTEFFFMIILFFMCHVRPLPKHVLVATFWVEKAELGKTQKSTFWNKKIFRFSFGFSHFPGDQFFFYLKFFWKIFWCLNLPGNGTRNWKKRRSPSLKKPWLYYMHIFNGKKYFLKKQSLRPNYNY